MSNWHKQTSSSEDTLLIAFSNLLRKFAVSDTAPAQLAQVLAEKGVNSYQWDSITDFKNELIPDRIGEYNTWPETNNAIVQYRIIDEKAAGVIDLYCIVASAADGTIIDSHDGIEKSGAVYGRPVAWASYLYLPNEEALAPTNEQVVTVNAANEREYVLQEKESLWQVARRFNLTAEELIEHNGFERPHDLPVGTVIHLPITKPKAEPGKVIKYEVLERPRTMHVSREGGAKKWSFGYVRKWDDLHHSGPLYPENYNVTIVAIARVPIGDEEAAYFLDKLALGDYVKTGRVTNTIGYNWRDLEDGNAPVKAPAPVAETKIEATELAVKVADSQGEIVLDRNAKLVDLLPKAPAPLHWKSSFEQFPAGPRRFLARETIMVHDLDTKRPSAPLHKNQGITIAGTFIKDEELYGRPKTSADNGHWFGIPMDYLDDEAEVFNYELDYSERRSLRRLSLEERLLTEPLAIANGKYVRLKTYITKIKNNNLKERK